MAKKEHAHLVKPLRVQEPPAGLYGNAPRVWMEGRDLEGFNAHFTYGFILEPCTLHPQTGALVHPYDECLIFAGLNPANIHDLGAEVSVCLGEEQEEHVFTKPTVVVVPRGTTHGPVTVSRVDRPCVHYAFGLAAEYKATAIPTNAKSTGSKYSHLVKRLITHVDPDRIGTGMGYERVVDREGVLRPADLGIGPGNADQLVWLFGKDLEGMDVNFTWGFYSRCGKWHRAGETHTHPEEEILVLVGLDPERIDYLGAELEIGMGGERHVFNTPTVAICPKGFPHLPQITRWVDKPYGFIVINLNREHDSPWVEVDV
jgi:hypothetical protein